MSHCNRHGRLVTSCYNWDKHCTMIGAVTCENVLWYKNDLSPSSSSRTVAYRLLMDPISRHQVRKNVITMGIQFLIGHICDVPEIWCQELLLQNQKGIPCIQLISLLHPTWRCWRLWPIIWKLETSPWCITALYRVDCHIKIIGVVPWHFFTHQVWWTVLDYSSMPQVKAFQDVWLGLL